MKVNFVFPFFFSLNSVYGLRRNVVSTMNNNFIPENGGNKFLRNSRLCYVYPNCHMCKEKIKFKYVTISNVYKIIFMGFEVLSVMTMKNAVFWDVAPCGSCKKRPFGGTCRLHLQGKKSTSEEKR
jgi:hypothetical protein